MKSRRYIYGLTGFLSLLGFIGVFTGEKAFLGFFAFAVDFQYFFIKYDEMLEEYMNKCAAKGFYLGMITTAAVTLFVFLTKSQSANKALMYGFTAGWIVAVMVHAISTAYYGIKESVGIENDK